MSGRVEIDKNGDRIPQYVLRNFRNGSTVKVGHFTSEKHQKFIRTREIIWFGGGTEVPDDDPECVFTKCPARGTRG